MTDQARAAQLDNELRAMGATNTRRGRDTLLTAVGIVLLLAGVVIAVVGYTISAGTSDPLRQSDAQTLGPIGITLSIAGLAVYLRYSTTQFLRFWLARALYERSSSERSIDT